MCFLSIDEYVKFEEEASNKNWRLAMAKEINAAIERNDTWEFAELLKGH